MDESLRWGRARYAALLIVSVFHVIVVAVLIIAAKTRPLMAPAPVPLELLVLSQQAVPEIPVSPSVTNRSKKKASAPVPPSTAITIDQSAPSRDVGPAVDWGQQAVDVAAAMAGQSAPERAQAPPAVSPSPFAQPPPHHKGDQIPTADGKWTVFVTDNCYQESKSITHITNATNTGKLLQTYCNRRSKEARGDLFKELNAYKRLHPDK